MAMQLGQEDLTGNGTRTVKREDEQTSDTAFTDMMRSLNEEQFLVFVKVVQGRQNVFLTGSAGTGKSHTFCVIKLGLMRKYGFDKVAVTAATGVAALHVGGQTLHKFSGGGLCLKKAEEIVREMNELAILRWQQLEVLLIDEISMINPFFLEKLDRIARMVRARDEPMGGMQLVMCGDFLQLAPVHKSNTKTLQTTYAFQAPCWETFNLFHVCLTKVHRQSDPGFVKILEEVRVAKVSPETDAILRSTDGVSKLERTTGQEPVSITATREMAKVINDKALSNLGGDTFLYRSLDWYVYRVLNTRHKDPKQWARKILKEEIMASKTLTLKVGAKVMLIKNLTSRLVNGKMGTVVDFLTRYEFQNLYFRQSIDHDHPVQFSYELHKAERQPYPVVRFDDEAQPVLVTYEEFDAVEGDKDDVRVDYCKVTRTQIPLIVAFAVTVHKCQGMSLPLVKFYASEVFTPGQVYVAISRCTSLEGLQIIGFDRTKVQANPHALAFHEGVRAPVTSKL